MKLDTHTLAKTVDAARGPAPPTYPHKATCVSLLFFGKQETRLLAVLKADREGYPWRNQIALPGGHIDDTDPTPMHAALRELEEELNIMPANVSYFGSLGHFQTLANRVIEVFVGTWNQEDEIRHEEHEIARVLKIPLKTILDTHISQRFHGRMPDYGELLYPYDGLVVWGVTAKIFHFFLEHLYPFVEESNSS
ncbi:MAG: CoA pyrophosphatase [Thermodesulfobacteriota bacterium]|nr:CoA pyrophosphatase [Thermodesulfobacteriota bacterium]